MASVETRADLYTPILTLIVGLTCSVYLFEQLEQERTQKAIGKSLFVASAALLVFFAGKERKLCGDEDVRHLYAFLAAASVVVTLIIIQE